MAGNGALDLCIRIMGKVDPSLVTAIKQTKGLTGDLDVYKRQVRGFHMNKIGSTLCGWDKIVEDFIAADLDAPVSYTHLDVYKRQSTGSIQSNAFRPS